MKELKSVWDKEDILEWIKFFFYTSQKDPKYQPDIGCIPTLDDDGVAKVIEWFSKRHAVNLTKEEFDTLIGYYQRYYDDTNNHSRSLLIEKLKDISFDRILVVTDGSFLGTKIDVLDFCCCISIDSELFDVKELTQEQKLDYIEANYESVVVHVNYNFCVGGRYEDFLDYIESEIINREMMDSL